jgi:hypothetical protein
MGLKMWCCPDGGTCHHECERACFRVLCCGPLSNVFGSDSWPEDVKKAHKKAAKKFPKKAGHI